MTNVFCTRQPALLASFLASWVKPLLLLDLCIILHGYLWSLTKYHR